MRSPARIALAVLLALALVAPAAATATSRSDAAALAQEHYYSSYGTPEATPAAPRVTTVTVEQAGAWKPIAIVAGALVLVLGAAELITLGRMRAARIA